MRPMVSVVIPTFNRGEHLINALESVFAQTHQDFEVIVIDDGSTDDTRDRLMPYMDRIRYFYQENHGASAARNKGIDVARGEWISTLDSDDVWLPAKLERQFEAIAVLGGDFGACFTDIQFVGDSGLCGRAFELGGLDKGQPFGILDNTLLYVLARHPVIMTPSLLVRRSLINELGGFDKAMIVGEDTDLFFRLALRTGFCFVAEPLVNVDRSRSRSVSLKELFDRSDDKAFSSKERMYRKWLAMPEVIDPALRSRILGLLRGLYYDWMVRKIYHFRFLAMFEKMKRAREIGISSLEILSTLVFRAGRRITKLRAQQGFTP